MAFKCAATVFLACGILFLGQVFAKYIWHFFLVINWIAYFWISQTLQTLPTKRWQCIDYGTLDWNTARPRDTRILVPEKNRAAQNRTLWGLYICTEVDIFSKNSVTSRLQCISRLLLCSVQCNSMPLNIKCIRITAWWLPDDCLSTAWQLPDECLTTAWRLLESKFLG